MTSSNHKIKSMLQRHAKGVDLTEMSYEDFLETFGRSQSLDTGKGRLNLFSFCPTFYASFFNAM